MELLLGNIGGKVRRETLAGRDYLVAPVTLLRPRVLNGSGGPLFYPADEIARNVSAWNGMPLVVYHPTENGVAVSARTPAAAKKSVGTVYHAKIDNEALVGEAWFDIERTQAVDARILNDLNASRQIEISTGLATENEAAPEGSEADGVAYTGIARNYRPDHLAILPDQEGACSISDGCGVLNSEALVAGVTGNQKDHAHLATVGEKSGIGSTSFNSGHSHQVTGFKVQRAVKHTHTLSRESLVDTGVRNSQSKEVSTMDATEQKAIVDSLIANACCWNEDDRPMLDSLDENALAALVRNADKQGEIDKAAELVANAATKEYTDSTGAKHTWDAKKTTWNTVASKGKGKPEPAKPQTNDEWLATAPADIQNTLRNAMEIEQREKTELINKLLVNVAKEDQQARGEGLQNRSLPELRDILSLMPAVTTKPPINWTGAGGGSETPNPVTNEADFAPWGMERERARLDKEQIQAAG